MKKAARIIRQQTTVSVCFLAFIFAFFPNISFAEIDADDIHEIEAADCQELAVAYQEFSEAETSIKSMLRESQTETIVTNVIGVTTLATLGLGFFTWENTSEADAYLAQIKEYMNAIRESASTKKCSLDSR